ncbi:amine oxidase catalytic domain-containing protein [Glonium stellatum]|uniref:Amine oxidase n=1 Tax=Glonium stellatum TaxID=574774 RepID=A0A8E2JP81_9PEZI|nr:amine oxidase catalytic domain-containing protein [Glonium stellatum]
MKSGGLRLKKRQPAGSGICATGNRALFTAPQKNIFLGLTDLEAASATSFLHSQSNLNLTAATNATSWDNIILGLELLQPNKSDALSYLDSGAPAPGRYARATVQFGATDEPYIQEWMVGPLPVTNGTTSCTPLNYIYNKGRGYQRVYNADAEALAAFNGKIGSEVLDITLQLLNGSATNSPNDTLVIAGNDPLIHENGIIVQWNQFWGVSTSFIFDETLLPTGLEFKVNVTGRNPSGWSVIGWYYNGNFYETADDLRKAMKVPGFSILGPNVDGPWGSTDQAGEILPNDQLYPPISIQPNGPRFSVDIEEKYVEWMDFSFYISFNKDTGMQLHNIKFKGERIIYELGMQEALAHYAGMDPLQSTTAYLDSMYGFGAGSYELVGGFDCPDYATYLNASFYTTETTHTHPNALCLFELDTGYPLQRHLTETYVSVTKNIILVLRSVSTVGNYDYMFEYAFYLDGSIHVTVRASGYIQGAYFAKSGDYGFHIHDKLSGSMHDHVLNYKLDLDIHGTANSLMKTAIVPVTETYPWSGGVARNTMKLEKSFLESENEGKINWDPNGVFTYTVVNKDRPNQFGEYGGYRIAPGIGNTAFLVIQNSTSLGQAANWDSHHLFAVRRKDTEPRSAYPYNSYEPEAPVVDFNKFFDGESLDQEDLVIYFNLGMHHIPDTADLPNTIFSSARSSMVIRPQNYLPRDPSRNTIHQVRVNFNNGAVTELENFGAVKPTCSFDMSDVFFNISSFDGEVIIPEYPYEPNEYYITNPGG